jgi:predicted porin
MVAVTLAAATLAQAQAPGATAAAPAPAAKPADTSFTWHGITLYGIVDLGLQYDTHSAPISDYFPVGSTALVGKNDPHSASGVVPNAFSQSRIGLSGNEPLIGDWAGVFRFETFFNPQSGNISDALKSLTLNNGKALANQVTGVDSSIAGQYFGGAAYAGFSSPTYGSFTFGRNVTLLADGIGKYDPMDAAQSFSIIGFSGTAAGGGDTEDRRLDQSLKYYGKYDWLHLGALYQFGGSRGSVNTGYQFLLGGDYAGLSIDAYYFKKYDAIGVGSLSAAQVAALCPPTPTPNNPPPPAGSCFSPSTALSGTISDNTTFSVMGSYTAGPVKFSGGYEHIKFDNPTNPLAPGSVIIGGYVLAYVQNAAYNNTKTLQVYWAGLKYTIVPDFDVRVAYYGYKQDSFAAPTVVCSSTIPGGVPAACSGREKAASILLDYRFSKRFDVYGGTFWSGVQDGLANGFLNSNNVATTLGLRFKF